MKILDLRSQINGAVRYLLREGYGEITVDVEGKAMTGFTRHEYEGDEGNAMKKAFKFPESTGW